jgi:hypothetical protein
MQWEIKTEGLEFVISRLPQPNNDNKSRQKADRKSGELLFTTELVAMDDTSAEAIKVITAGEPKAVNRQGVAVPRLVATPWNVDGRGGVAFRAHVTAPFTASASGSTTAP